MIAKIPNENDSAARKENNWNTFSPKRIPMKKTLRVLFEKGKHLAKIKGKRKKMVTKGILFGPKVPQLFSFLPTELFYLSLAPKVFGFGEDYPPRMAMVYYIIRWFLGHMNGSENDNLWVPIP